jgi:hypothetical protein
VLLRIYHILGKSAQQDCGPRIPALPSQLWRRHHSRRQIDAAGRPRFAFFIDRQIIVA